MQKTATTQQTVTARTRWTGYLGWACLIAAGCLLAGWLLPASVDYSNAIIAATVMSAIMLAAVIVRYCRRIVIY